MSKLNSDFCTILKKSNWSVGDQVWPINDCSHSQELCHAARGCTNFSNWFLNRFRSFKRYFSIFSDTFSLFSIFFAHTSDSTTSRAPFAHPFYPTHQRDIFLHFYRIYFQFVWSIWNVNVIFFIIIFFAWVVRALLACMYFYFQIALLSFSAHLTKH